MRKVTVADVMTRGGRSDGRELEIADERLTVCELIPRVFQRVAGHNARQTEGFQGLARSEDAEVTSRKPVSLVGG
ncbi:hypothetical protein [Streptomyces sp. IB2014 016-6]|uniref:hypothetical protein n=1 Tax=Streptomyces sp. IB2014 016-6 TaxID=2517818 RepID=UPI0011C96241|nr:hypothetical protein [Streptomyces sp. IB2014 016-6]TXL88112.1 hypothetical protein EW053_19885 [Streptomyces sp. IB2014 016-6]